MNQYKLESFKRVDAPNGAAKKVWYEYTISSHINTITGCRAGSYQSVFEFVMDCLVTLNQHYIPGEEKAGKIFNPVYNTQRIVDSGSIRTDW